MKALLNSILNNRRKPVKTIGVIVSNPNHLKYVIRTQSGKVQVEGTIPYRIGDKIVAFDGLIQGFAGNTSTPTVMMV